MEPTTIIRDAGAPEQSHHVAAGIAYLAVASVPVAVTLAKQRDLVQPGVLLPVVALGFLAACAFYRARFGDDALPDRIERTRRATTYWLGVSMTAVLCLYLVVSVAQLL
ncbi:hypothetical protein [Nocardioides ultimimeridianus]